VPFRPGGTREARMFVGRSRGPHCGHCFTSCMKAGTEPMYPSTTTKSHFRLEIPSYENGANTYTETNCQAADEYEHGEVSRTLRADLRFSWNGRLRYGRQLG